MGFYSKTVVSFSSLTASWEAGRRIKRSCDINGALMELVISKHTSTARGLFFYRGTTTPGNFIGKVPRSTQERTYRLYGRMAENSSGAFLNPSTGALKFPWVLANEKIVVCGGTQTAGTVTIYVEGTVGSSQV